MNSVNSPVSPSRENAKSYDSIYFLISCRKILLAIPHKTSKSSSMLRGAMSLLGSPSSTKLDNVSVVVHVSDTFLENDFDTLQQDDLIEYKEQYRSESLRKIDSDFTLGFQLYCLSTCNRHVKFEVQIKPDGHDLLSFGSYCTNFREISRLASSASLSTTATVDLPLSSPFSKDSFIQLNFLDISRYKNKIVPARRPIMKFFRRDQEAFVLEEAVEVDFCYQVPAEFLEVCLENMKKRITFWKDIWNKKRLLERRFKDSQEAIEHGCVVLKIKVVEARGLQKPSSSSTQQQDSILETSSSVLGRFKSKAEQWVAAQTSKRDSVNLASITLESTPKGGCNAVVSVHMHLGESGDTFIGRTNTEYDTNTPKWGENAYVDQCAHSKPNIYFSLGNQEGDICPFFSSSSISTSSIPNTPTNSTLSPNSSQSNTNIFSFTSTEVNPLSPSLSLAISSPNEKNDKDVDGFILYLPPKSPVLDGCLEFHLGHERFNLLSGIDYIPIDTIVLPLELLNDKIHDGYATIDQWFSIEGKGEIRIVLEMTSPTGETKTCNSSLSEKSQFEEEDLMKKTELVSVSSTKDFLITDLSLVFLSKLVNRLLTEIEDTKQMIHLFNQLSQQGKCFKSSQHKKRADIQAAPTNLHISYLTINTTLCNNQNDSTFLNNNLNANFCQENQKKTITDKGLKLYINGIFSLTTSGAPTAHALGLRDYGLQDMEFLMKKKQEELFAITGKAVISSIIESIPSPWGQPQILKSFISLEEEERPRSSSFQQTQEHNQQQQQQRSLGAGVQALASLAKATAKAATNKKQQLHISKDDFVEMQKLHQELETLKADYYFRKVVSVSQAITTFVSSFVSFIELCLLQEQEDSNCSTLNQIAEIGFLVGWESLISSQGKELHMLSDTRVAIRSLSEFKIQFTCFSSQEDEKKSSNRNIKDKIVSFKKTEDENCIINISIQEMYFKRLPQVLQEGKLVNIIPVLFTQGINEMQSLANIVGVSGVQTTVNAYGFRLLKQYFEDFTHFRKSKGNILLSSFTLEEIRCSLTSLEISIRDSNTSSKDTDILMVAADIVRALNGGRITYCKSGKDRTAMSATLEQSRIAFNHNILEKGQTLPEKICNFSNILREYGVRLLIAKKNVGRMQYSFNSLQRKMLPEIYRPPSSTIQDMVTSVTARDS